MTSTLVYHLVLILHVIGALGLSAAFSIEAIGLIGLRRATSSDEARLWLASRRWVLVGGPPSIGVVLVSGIYMTVAEWGAAGWILVSLGTLIAIAVIGGVLTGITTARLAPKVEAAAGPMSDELRNALRNPILTASLLARIALVLGIVYLMVQQPDIIPSIAVIVLAAGVGGLAGVLLGRGGSSTRTTVRAAESFDFPRRIR